MENLGEHFTLPTPLTFEQIKELEDGSDIYYVTLTASIESISTTYADSPDAFSETFCESGAFKYKEDAGEFKAMLNHNLIEFNGEKWVRKQELKPDTSILDSFLNSLHKTTLIRFKFKNKDGKRVAYSKNNKGEWVEISTALILQYPHEIDSDGGYFEV